MAGGALQLGVRAEQRESAPPWRDRKSTAASRSANGSSRISCRDRPCARHRAHGSRCTAVAARPNASVAWHCAQLTTRCRPSSGKCGQVMIEHDVGPPGILAVTGLAAALELAAVRILAAMAADAVLGELLAWRPRPVWQVWQSSLACAPMQRELGLRGVIVGHRMPVIVVVAVLALGAEARGMRIVGPMAAVAVLRNLVLVIAAAMTGEAIDLGVHAEQRRSRFP